jgi:hypothetical protein
VTILPLRNLVLVRLRPSPARSSLLHVIMSERVARQADVVAVGPEVRDLVVGQIVVVNSVAGTAVGDSMLLAESAILGTL